MNVFKNFMKYNFSVVQSVSLYVKFAYELQGYPLNNGQQLIEIETDLELRKTNNSV